MKWQGEEKEQVLKRIDYWAEKEKEMLEDRHNPRFGRCEVLDSRSLPKLFILYEFRLVRKELDNNTLQGWIQLIQYQWSKHPHPSSSNSSFSFLVKTRSQCWKGYSLSLQKGSVQLGNTDLVLLSLQVSVSSLHRIKLAQQNKCRSVYTHGGCTTDDRESKQTGIRGRRPSGSSNKRGSSICRSTT